MTTRMPILFARALMLLAIPAVLLTVSIVLARGAEAAHGSVVPEQPRQDLPVALDGTVFDTVQVGYRVYVVGDFTSVGLPDGSTVAQPYMFAYDIDTGAYIADFDPVIENGSITSIDATPDGQHLVIGGTFTRIDGRWRVRVAKLNLDGEVDVSFTASADARVQDVAVSSDTVYLGGNFTALNGTSRNHIGAVRLDNGATIANFDFPITTPVGRGGTGAVKAMDLSPDGTKLVAIFNSLTVAGQDRGAVAVFNVGGPTPSLDDWQTTIYRDGYLNCNGATLLMRDVEISPDGTYFVVVTSGHDYPPACDTANAFPMNGGANTQPLWVTRMFDSTFSVGISDVAVYVGGHFCFTEGPNSPDFGFETFPHFTKPAACQTGTANANVDSPPWVARRQIAALDPATGWALDWDPGSNADVAVFSLEVSNRGLMLGHDNDRVNQIATGRHAFFDLGPVSDTVAPAAFVASPATNGEVTGSSLTISGNATDDYRVSNVTVRLHNTDNNTYLQDDETIGAGANTLSALIARSAADTVWELDVAGLTPGTYVLDVWATDLGGNVTATPARRTFVVPFSTPTCAVTLTDNGNPKLEWTPVAGVSTWSVRRDGSWLATANNALSYTDSGLAPGSYSYSVRYKAADGVRTDVECTPNPVTVAGNANTTPSCTATVNGSSVELLWNDLVGVDDYKIRRDGSWLENVGDTSSSVDVNVPAGSHLYEIRHRSGGANIDTSCGTVTVGGAAASCAATVNGTDVTLGWTSIPGESSYVVRRDGAWVSTENATTTFTDSPGAGTYSYTIRYFAGGAIDLDCGTVTVANNNVGPSCAASVVGGEVVVSWSAVAGEDRYVVRRDGVWLGTVTNGTSYIDSMPLTGTSHYVVRWKQGGVQTDLNCGSVTL